MRKYLIFLSTLFAFSNIAHGQDVPSAKWASDLFERSKPGYCDAVRKRLNESRKIIAEKRQRPKPQSIAGFVRDPFLEKNISDFATDLHFFGRRIVDNECPSRDMEEAIAMLRESASLGDDDSKYYLAKIFWSGQDVPRNNRQAKYWFHGYMLASIQYNDEERTEKLVSEIISPTMKKYVLLYLEEMDAVLHASPQGLLELARDLRGGNGVPKDLGAAYLWMERAAMKGSEIAKRELAELLIQRVEPRAHASPQIEESLFLSSKEGNVRAMIDLARRKEMGDGIFKNTFDAYVWFLRARRRNADVANDLRRVSYSLNFGEIAIAYLFAYGIIDD